MALSTKFVRTQSKGMVTIPIEFREKLGIDPNSLLEVRLIENGVMFVKLEMTPRKPELYSDHQIKEWVKIDQMDEKTVKKLRKLLKR